MVSTSVGIYLWQEEKAERERLEINLDQYGRDISNLTLTNEELKTEKEKQNKTILEADSILKAKNRRISRLESLVATKVVIKDTDTVYVPLETAKVDTLPTLFKSNFTNTKSCITVSGFILSTDSVPSLAITERSTDVRVFDIRIKRKWWEFWRPKEERFVETNCGEVEIETIYKKK